VKHPGTGEDDRATGVIFSKTIPILRIFDIVKAREFYVDYLGFAIDWEHRFSADAPLYMP
jgi:Glyoxalase superfamily protein